MAPLLLSVPACPEIECFLLLSDKLPYISSLKMSVFIIKHLCSSKVHHCVVLCSESHKAEIKMLEELHYREIPGKNLTSGLFSFSKDLVPSSCRTELPFSCWPLTGGHCLLLEASFRSFSHDPLSSFKLGMA